MGQPIHIDSFRNRNVTPLPPSDQRILDISIRLMLSAALPPRIRNARTADARDIALRVERFKLVHVAYTDFLAAMFAELNENMPITQTIRTADIFAGLSDIASDAVWEMERAADRDRDVR